MENFINQEIPCQTVGDFKIGGWSLRSPFFVGDTNERIKIIWNIRRLHFVYQYRWKKIFSAKENDRNHTRKYLGIVYSINGYNYYIPLSSPKNSDYRMENGVQKIRGSIVPIIRITSQSSSGELELKGTLKLSNMIPVPASELTLYDMEHEPDLFYKALIHKEMLFIRKNKNKIIQNAKILYKQKKENNPAIGYLKSTVDFSLLEQMHDKFIEKKSN